jgi:hypothetical protein
VIRRLIVLLGASGLLTGAVVIGTATPAAAHNCGSLVDCLPSARSLLIALAAILIVAGVAAIMIGGAPLFFGGGALALASGGVAASAGAVSMTTVAAGATSVVAGTALAMAAEGASTGGGSGGSDSGGGSGSGSSGGGDPSRSVSFRESQLQHAFRHADDFGVTGNWNKAAGEAFQRAIQNHVDDAATQVIQGTYRGQPATHFYNPNTGLNVIRTQGGEFWSGWRLSPQQVQHLLRNGSLGGG